MSQNDINTDPSLFIPARTRTGALFSSPLGLILIFILISTPTAEWRR